MMDTLYPHYADAIRRAAVRLGRAERIKTRYQWLIAETANDEWIENGAKYQQRGLNQEDFNSATSQAINQAIGFTLITETGNTLKMWREVTAQFEHVDDNLKKLPFDYFRKARTLWGMSERGETVKHITAPIAPIAEAVALQLDATEMYALYTDPTRAFNSLQPLAGWTAERKVAFAAALEDFRKAWF